MDRQPLPATNIATLLADPGGGLWIGLRPGGVLFLQDGHVTRYGNEAGLPAGTVQQLAIDRDGSLWAAARSGLAHLNGKRWDVVSDDSMVSRPYALLVDPAGTLWVAAANGLFAKAAGEHRFRAIDTRTYSDPRGGLFASAPDGRVWAIADHELRQSNATTGAPPGNSIALAGISGPLLFDAAGNLWAADNARPLLHHLPSVGSASDDLQGSADAPVKLGGADDMTPENVGALLQDREHNIWVGTDSSLHRFSRSNVLGNVTPYCPQTTYRSVFAAGDARTLWVVCNDESAGHLYEIRAGAVVSQLAIYADGGEIWVGGESGLARFDGTRFVAVHRASHTPFTGVSGIIRARNGDLWLDGFGGIAHITRVEIAHVEREPAYRVRTEIFDRLDGVPGIPVMLQSTPSVIETDEGRLWFMMTGGIVSIDPTQLTHNTLPPPVRIWSLTSGVAHFPNVRAAPTLPANTTDRQLDYGAASLTVPERVNFRYRLEGSDRDWQDVGTRREARYTNLGPGHYTFCIECACARSPPRFAAAWKRASPSASASRATFTTRCCRAFRG